MTYIQLTPEEEARIAADAALQETIDTIGIEKLRYSESINSGDLVNILNSGEVKKNLSTTGDIQIVRPNNALYLSNVMLSSTLGVVIYSINGTTLLGISLIQLNNSNEISILSEITVINAGPSSSTFRGMTDVFRINNNRVFVFASNAAFVVDVRNETLTVGTICYYNTHKSGCCTSLDNNKYVAYYPDGPTNVQKARVLTVDGMTVTSWPELTITSTFSQQMNIGALSTDKVLISSNENTIGTARILDVTLTNTLQVGSAYTFVTRSDYSYNPLSVVGIDATKGVISYADNSKHGYSVVCNISGTSISYGTPLQVSSQNTLVSTSKQVSEDTIILCHSSGGLYLKKMKISGDVISIDDSIIIGGTYINYDFDIYDNKLMFGGSYWYDGTNFYIGYIIMIPFEKHAMPKAIALETGTTGNIYRVGLNGIINLSGIYTLIPGLEYYLSGDGLRLITKSSVTRSNVFLDNVQQEAFGIAISTTHLKIY